MNQYSFCFALMTLLAGCVGQPLKTTAMPSMTPAQLSEKVSALLPADVLLLGEQHDAAE